MNKEDIIAMAIKSHLVMYDYNHPSLEAFAKLVAEKNFEQGFYAGFKASGEGWNGECPFNDLGLDIQQNESVQHELKEAMENYQKGQTD